jgi:hypothetical protein
MTKLRARLAQLRARPWPLGNDKPSASSIRSAQATVPLPASAHLTVSEVPFITQVRLKFGPAVALIELSSEGAQIETINVSLQPGSTVVLEMTGKKGQWSIPARVLRCQLASLRTELVYRGTLTFDSPLDLKDLGSDSVDGVTHILSPALESERLQQLLTPLFFQLSGRLDAQTVLTAPVSDALNAALATLDCPAGRRAGPAMATGLAALFKLTADVLAAAPTATALVDAIKEQLRHLVPARAIRDADSFLLLPGSEAILVTVPSLDSATPVRELTIEFADDCEPLELHLQLLKAGVQLIAIARELGRLNGYDRPLTALARPAASSVVPKVVIVDERRAMPKPIASSEYRIEKSHAQATLLLSTGEVVRGHFFLGVGPGGEGLELVGQLLNSATSFALFEQMDSGVARTVLYNLTHVVLVTLAGNEARREPGYEVARRHVVSLLLSTSQRIVGVVHASLPSGHDRVSDWARDGAIFRYVETDDATVIVNVQHVIAITESKEA